MAHPLLLALLILPGGVLVSSVWGVVRNYRAAQSVGLPIIFLPISLTNLLWMMLVRHVIPLLERVPFGSGYFTRFCYTGWEFKDKSRAHVEFGDAFITVTPGKNWVYLCNAEAVSDVLRRERQGEFERPVEMLAMLDVFGPNLSTVHGRDWQRQRKCTAASFNEHNNAIVWTESLHQARQMLNYWKSAGEAGVRTTAHDVRTLALDVLLSAGFGKSFSFTAAQSKTSPSGPLSYRDALALILENAVLIFAIGPRVLQRLYFVPGLGRLAQATVEFKQYMIDLIDQSKHESHVRDTQANLLTSLVRAAVQDKQLSQDEVLGNMFVFNFAGHDTTAITLAYTFMLLAVYPEVQEWLAAEINHVVKSDDIQQWDYDIFPNLPRTLAVLLETVRLYDPLLSLVKVSEHRAAILTIGDKEHTIPAGTRVLLNLNALHTHPRYWGNDGHDWRPSRWIKTVPGEGASAGGEELITPVKGSYLPWGEGLRACPGKKFAQVEHVAVMAAIFRDHCVMPVKEAGEDDAAARLRVLNVVNDSGMVLLLQMFHPEKAALQWKKRA
ncbi:cytochrome P450 monooxygenase-like protein [Trematosphaeria pertusa]|uniref:Cytochrome P450 monooxygenase-like protein n=1 Tax=Trematosphaeria pertusa TaxID=390896 RepID=A0A6A6IEV1_9PLEO|nr:cytochrome P450 monooxygenase-like protein [Trematosphaeria pertusa]KAF2248737.1 cytochrome P450 monooxygenase-like protein [Trematosphaeria pertusa]